MTYIVDIREFSGFPEFKKRFLSYLPEDVFIQANDNVCWNWKGAKRSGYGSIGWCRETYFAHRISYLIFKGLIPANTVVRHTCDNKLCVNPKHLILGTASDNQIDSVKRNRHYYQKLDQKTVKLIKWMVTHNYTRGLNRKLAKAYNVTHQTISDIKKERSWAWVKVEENSYEK